jgi:hypothetical protein
MGEGQTLTVFRNFLDHLYQPAFQGSSAVSVFVAHGETTRPNCPPVQSEPLLLSFCPCRVNHKRGTMGLTKRSKAPHGCWLQ